MNINIRLFYQNIITLYEFLIPFTVDSGGIMWYIISVCKRNIKHQTARSFENGTENRNHRQRRHKQRPHGRLQGSGRQGRGRRLLRHQF